MGARLMKRVSMVVLGLFATIGSASADTLSVADVLVDFEDLVGKQVTADCGMLSAAGPSPATCIESAGSMNMIMVDLTSATRENRKFAVTKCATFEGCSVRVTGKLGRFFGSTIPILNAPEFEAR